MSAKRIIAFTTFKGRVVDLTPRVEQRVDASGKVIAEQRSDCAARLLEPSTPSTMALDRLRRPEKKSSQRLREHTALRVHDARELRYWK